jgi:hypothetical protein
MNKVLEIDETSCIARIQAGTLGPDMELVPPPNGIRTRSRSTASRVTAATCCSSAG